MKCYALAALLWAAHLKAETTAENTNHHLHFDRSTAIEQALSSNRDLNAARAVISQAEARLRASGRLDNPSLELEYGDDRFFNNEGERSYAIKVTQSLPLSRRLAKQRAVSEVAVDLALQEVAQFETKLVEEISDFALDIHLVDTQIEQLQSLRSSLGSSVDFAKSKAAAGEVSPLDASQLELELRILDQDLENLKIDRERLIHKLAPLLGLESSEHFEFDSHNTIPYSDGNFPGYDPSVLERSPSYQTAKLAEASSQAKVLLSQTADWDEIKTSLTFSNERSFDAPLGLEEDQSIGLSVSVPLPLRKKGEALADIHRAEVEQTRYSQAAIRFRIQNDIEHARHEANITSVRMQDYRTEVIAFAERQLEQLNEAYQNGTIDMLTLLRAQEQRIALEKGYLELYEQHAHARLELELYRFDYLNR